MVTTSPRWLPDQGLFQEIKLFSAIISLRLISKTLIAKSLDALGILHIILETEGDIKVNPELELD